MRFMADATQTILTVSIPTLAVLIGILVNKARLSDLNKRSDEFRADIDRRFDAMEKLFTEKLLRVEQVVDARIKNLEENRARSWPTIFRASVPRPSTSSLARYGPTVPARGLALWDESSRSFLTRPSTSSCVSASSSPWG
jgi:hypothetical protein